MGRQRRCLEVGLFLALSVPSALSAPQQWLWLATPNFELYTTAGEKEARQALLRFEQVRGFFLSIGQGAPQGLERIVLIGFDSKKEFEPYRPKPEVRSISFREGDRNYIALEKLDDDTLEQAVFHYVQLLLRGSDAQLPLWLRLGLAELYSTLKPRAGRVQVGALIEGHVQALQRNKWLALETLTSADYDSPAYTAGGEPTRVFYAQSWALTHMLVLSDRYGPRYRDFTRLLLAGASAAEAFQGAFGKPISRVESELGGYLRGEWFKVVYFDTKLQKESESPQVRQASPAEAGLVLARLYREADTQELMLAKLAEENPQSWEVAEAQGYFEWQRKRNPEAALAHFERAAQLGAGSARMYYDYALLLGRERGQEEKRIALLRKALELQPDFQEPKLALGVALYNQRLYAQAVAALNGVRQVNRDEALSMFRILAHSYHQLGQPEDARKAAERLREISRTPREVEDAEELLRYVSRSPGSEELEAAASISGDGPADEPAPARPAPAGERPRLERRSASANPPAEPPAPAARPRMRMEGTLFQFDCLGDAARLTVLHSGRRVSFAILDPADVRIRGAESATLDFSCGRQQPLAVVIEFEEKVDGRLGTTGVVKAIEFQ